MFFPVVMDWWVIPEVFKKGVILCKINLDTVIKDFVRTVFLTCSQN